MFNPMKVSLAPAIAMLGLGFFISNNAMANMPPPEAGQFIPLQAIHDKLKLDDTKEKTWQGLVQKMHDMREAGRNEHQESRAQLKQEMDKDNPDFAALAARSDRIADERTAARRHVRDEWLKLYETFSPAQKIIVRDEIKARLEKSGKRLDRMHQKREKSGQH
ncbi:MAG: periplasmic heavy metal sensor [Sulfuricella denitrificans]|nr:periplasmic heavy metal sensor [Sulfuricella denitrificans]